MAGGNVKYTFQVDANTSQAKKALDELRRSMDQLANAQAGKSFFDENINKAVESAKELKYHLNQAMDAKTGQLNLNAFNKSLKEAGQSSAQLMQNLLNGGAQGQQTFVALASAIAQTDVPIRRMNQSLRDFGTTLKNTVKWELSSGIVHGLVREISGAVSYAKNLNASLTDIRIVTGKSVEDMTRFAEQANKAAKSLSTTTKAYTDASLIYYQQGDDEEAVKKKTEITLKAANASVKTSAAEMSEYLTAVWNSYQVGADELERYVDIMAALGAKTATSLEEIATSMQKVAATGNTVGVSMEQVSSIIATVSSVTRESAESIGTSYKTIFARMGDLKLGAKDEDGIGLGQVSKSLESIGVEVLDASGELREMGDIITDLGDKWQGMSNAEKTAIAQVVAGKRQYTQLMALFENWDMYQQNMSIAQDSDGSLQKMQDIQAQSWEAAANRQKAAMESIYGQVINDQAMIKFTDGITGAIEGISGLIDSFGGLSGTLTKFGSIATAIFQKSLAKGINNAAQSVSVFMSQFQGKNFKEVLGMFSNNKIKNKEQIEFDKYNKEYRANLDKMVPRNQTDAIAIQSAKELMNTKEQLLNVEHRLSDSSKARAQNMIGDLSKEQSKLVEMTQEYEELTLAQKKYEKDSKTHLQDVASREIQDGYGVSLTAEQAKSVFNQFFSQEAFDMSAIGNNPYGQGVQDFDTAFDALKTSLSDQASIDAAQNAIRDISNTMADGADKTDQMRNAIKTLKELLSDKMDVSALDSMAADATKLDAQLESMKDTARQFSDEWDKAANNLSDTAGAGTYQAMRNMKQGLSDNASMVANAKFGLTGQQSVIGNLKKSLTDLFSGDKNTTEAFGKQLASIAGTAMSIADAFHSGANMVDTLTDKTASLGSKMMSVASAASSLVSGFMSGGPWGLVLSAVGLIASAVMQGFQEAEEKRKKLFDETVSEAEQKTSDNSAELSNAQSLLNTYNELYARYEAGEDVQSELTASAMSLAEAYGIADAAIAAMSGDFKEFNKQLENNLKFTKQLTDAENAKKLAEGAVGQAKVGKIKNVSDIDLGFTHSMDGPTVEAQEAVASAEGAILSYAENLMLSRDTDTWKFLDQAFAQGADINDEWTGDYTFGATSVLSDFINFAKEEGKNAQLAFDDLMASHGIEGIDMGDEEAILTALDENGISVGAFLEHFYSLVIKKGTENLSLLDSGFSMKEVGSWGETTVVDSLPDLITDVNAIIMEPFQEQVEQAAFSLESIKGEYSDLWDSESGKFTWDDNASAARKLELYERYVAWEEQLRQRLTEVGTDSPEGDMINSLITEIEKITGNEELTTSIGVYKDATENLQRWTIVQNSLKEFIGKNPLNTTFSDYIKFHEDIIRTIDSQPAAYEELGGLTPEDGEEYIQKRNLLAQKMIADSSAFDDYATMYTSIISSFDGKSLELVTGLIDAEQMSLDEITSDFINVLKIFFANAGQSIDGLTVQNLQESELIKSVMANRQAVLDFNEHQTGYEKAKTAASTLSQDMSMEEAQNLYNSFWGNKDLIAFMQEQNDPLIGFEQFIGKSYEERTAYLDDVTEKYLSQVETDAENIISTHEESLTQLTEQAKQISSVFSSEENRQKGESLYEGFIGNFTETEDGWISNLDPSQVYADKNAAFEAYKTKQAESFEPFGDLSLEDWENFYAIQQNITRQNSDFENAQGFLQWMQLIGDESLTTTEKIQTYSDAVSSLASEYSDFAKTGKLSTKAMQDFAKLGINPDNIKNATDYIEALRTARDNAQGLLDDLMYEGYDAAGPGEGVEVGSEEYNKWIEVRNIQLEVLGLTDTIFNATISNGEAQISAMEARVNKLKEDAEKIKETAGILESAIETGQLNQQQRTQLEINNFDLSAWDNAATVIERANIAAKQYSQYAIDIAKASEGTSTFYKNTANQLHEYDSLNATINFGEFSSEGNFDNFISDMVEFKNMSDDAAEAWKKAYDSIRDENNNFEGMSNTEIIAKVREELERLGEDAGDAGKIAAAAARDNINAIFNGMADEHKSKAQEAANAWMDAFEQIAAARQKLISGESLVEDIAGNPEVLMQYLQAYRRTEGNENASAYDLYSAMSSNNLLANQLGFQAFDINQQKAAYGLDLTNNAGTQFGTFGVIADHLALQTGNPQLDGQTYADWQAAIKQQQIDNYAKMLVDTGRATAGNGKTAQEVAVQMAKDIVAGVLPYDLIQDSAQDLTQSFDVANLALQENTAYQEALNTYNQEKANQQEVIDESQSYSDITGSILELSPEERTAGAIAEILSNAGITTDDYLTSMQQKGLQVDNLSDVASLSDQALSGYKHSLAQDAIAAGETIKSAATAFKAIVTGEEEGQLGYGEESAEGQVATAAVEEATDIHQGLMDASYVEAYTLRQNQFNTSLTGAEDQLSSLVGLESVTQGTTEWAQGIDDLSDAYADLEGAQEIIDQLNEGTIDLNEANDQLTDITLKSVDAVYDYNEAQWDQYKQTLRNNNVTIDGYESLEEYFDEIESGRKKVKKWAAESKKLNKTLKTQGKNLDKNKDGLLDYGEAADEVQAAWQDLFDKGLIDEKTFEDGKRVMSKGVQDILAEAERIAAANPEYDFSQGLIEAVQQYSGDSAQALADLGIMMGLNADLCNQLAAENSVVALQNLIVDAQASGSINWGNIPQLVAQINAWMEANGIAGKRLVSPTGGSGGGGGGRSGGGGSGGGGGGGGGQEKQEKEKKRYQDEIERYHRNESAIKQVENELDKLSAKKDAAYGKKYVDAIEAETAALRREREEQEKLKEEALSYVKIDASKLQAAGAVIGENGVIENYDALMEQWIDEYNAAVDAWNNSDQDEDDEEDFEEAEQLYEDRLQLIEDYEEALDTAADAETRLQEILNEISENTLEGITYTLELELEVNERDLELLEYYREQYEDTLEDQDNLFANLMQQANEYETNFASLQDAYRNLMAEYNSGDLQEDEYAEGLADLHSQILENLENLQDVKDEIAEVYSNALDLATEEVENATEALDHMNETMEAYIAIMGLSGRETDYATMQAFYDAQFATNMANIEVQTEMLAGLREQEEYFKNRKEQNGELTDLEQEQYDALMKKIRETESAVLDSTQTTLEVLQAGYENTINRIAQDLDEFMAGAAGSISHLQEQYAYFREEQGRYVSTAKELYEVSSLNRDIENTLAETTSAASKEALKALQEKINKQSELNEMTEYDIEMNQLQYQLLLARIQLEEAQNSKDTVRLTRDDNGNYAYQYTADEDKVSEAMQKYEDTLQKMNDVTVQRTSEIEQQMINSMAEYKEKMQEIAMDTTLSESEKYNRLLELQSQFDAEMAYLQEQAGIANENLLANQEAIADHYGVNITAITSSTAGNVNQTVQDMIANAQQYSQAMHDALFGPDGVSQSWSDYLAAVTTVQQASGTTVDDMLNNTANVGEVNEDAVQTALDAIEALTGTLEPINQMTEAWDAHQAALQGTIDSYEDLLVHINDLMAALGQTSTNPNLDPEGTNTNASTRAAATFDRDQEEKVADETNVHTGDLMPNEEIASELSKPGKSSGGGGGGGKKTPQYGREYFEEVTEDSLAAAADYTDDLANKIDEISDHYVEAFIKVAEDEELTESEKYKQILELQNIFDEEMEMLRESHKKQQLEYANLIDESEQMYDLWLNQIDTLTQFSMLNSYHAQGLINEAPVVIDQNVTIEAEFPNVSNTDEIIEAFNELINRAAQFASAKK